MPNISLTNTTFQLAELQRRQKLADMLSAQGNEPFEVQSYKGIQAPISPYAGLAKLLQTYIGAKQSSDIEKKRGEVGKISGEEFTNFMKNYEGTPEVRSDMKTVAASQPAPLAALTAPPEMINTAKPFVAAGTPPQKMAQALQSSMGKGDIIASPQRVYGNAAPEAAPEAAVLAQARTNTPQEKMAMLMQGMTSGNPYMEKFAPSMYEKASKEEDSNKVFSVIDKTNKDGADSELMAMYKAANDVSGATNYLKNLGLKKEEVAATIAAYKMKALDMAEQNALNRQSREELSAENRADRQQGRAEASADRKYYAILAAGKLKIPPAKVQQDYIENIASTSNIDNALRLVSNNPKSFGLVYQGGDAINQRIDPKGTDARAVIANIGSQIIHDRSGAAVTISETPRLQPFIPAVTDKPDIVKRKLNLLRQAIAEENSFIKSLYTEDNGYKPFKPQAAPTATGGTKLVYNKTTGELEPR